MQNIISMDIGATKTNIALVAMRDDSHEILSRVTIPSQPEGHSRDLLPRISEAIDIITKTTNVLPDAIGIGCGGRIDIETGEIIYASKIMPDWQGQNPRAFMENRYGVPCAVINDVQAWGYGEANFGGAKDASCVLVIAVGTGVGSGIVVDGKLYRGARGFAGELGATLHPDVGKAHDAVSGRGIENRYEQETGEKLAGPVIAAKADAGDETARRIILDSARILGETIPTWTDLIDPEVVIIGGSVAVRGGIWEEELRRSYEAARARYGYDVPILFASLGNDAPLLGAAQAAADILE